MAMRNLDMVKVLKPQNLVDEIKSIIRNAEEKYN